VALDKIDIMRSKLLLLLIDMSLPVAEVVDEILNALRRQHDIILCAPTGAGKSTWLPLQLLAEPALSEWRILMLEPRRIAARAVASYLAQQLGEQVGETVGYRIRQESRVSTQTRLEVVTEGVLTRMLQVDPELDRYQLVIFDECHERSLQADLAFSLCLDMRDGLRDDLQLMLMSATPDIAAYQQLLPEAVAIHSQGRLYPVSCHHRPQPRGDWLPGMLAVIAEAVQTETGGSLLAFLPGAGEIRRLQQALEQDDRFASFELLPLHGGLPFAQQTAALKPPVRRRITLATNVAETSLTLPDIRLVVDSGRERVVRFQLKNSIEQLVTRRLSQASARQRAGRAGRLGPGACYRLWSEGEQQGLSEQLQPEISRSDLSGLLLECILWGVNAPEQLNWLTPPPDAAWQQAKALLVALRLISDKGQITEAGRLVQQLGLTPRLGAMLVALQTESAEHLASGCLAAAVLSEADPLRGRDDVDLQARLDWVLHANTQPVAKRILQQAQRWYKQLCSASWPAQLAPLSAYWLSFAFPDRIAVQRGKDTRSYQLSSGFGVELAEQARPLGRRLLVAQLSASEQHASGVIRLAVAFSDSQWQQLVSERATQRQLLQWDADKQRVVAQSQQKLVELVIERRRAELTDQQAAEALLLKQIVKLQLAPLPWSEAASHLWQRIQLCASLSGAQPKLDQQRLIQEVESWLAPYLAGLSSFAELASLDLCAMLRYYIGAETCRWLDKQLPSHFSTPLGRKLSIHYPNSEQAIVRLPMQELYGFDQQVSLADGRLQLAFELLSPAKRPIQLTTDLPGFWRGNYAEVRKEMHGRYPKHYWPEQPQLAQPTRHTKRHLNL